MTDYRTPYTEEEATHLRDLAARSAGTNGNDPEDSDRRKAGDEFADTVHRIRFSVTPEYSWPELAHQLGMKPDTLRAKLARRRKGGVEPSDSMKEYSGKPHNANRRTPTHFSCGCARTEDNTYWKPGPKRSDGTQGPDIDYCRHHQLERLRKGRQTGVAA